MAKRKAARATARRAAGTRASAGGSRTAAAKKKKAASRGTATRKGAAKRTAKGASKAARPKTGASARKAGGAAKTPARKQTSKAKKTVARRASTPARTATPRSAPPAPKTAAPVRKSPALNRARRIVTDDEDIVQTPPSSLDLDRSASAARTGRRSLRDRYAEHTETSPALTGGDVDADWESAYSVGDEAPGGDNPTPDQDIVDDIGKAVGIEYQDNEELKGADKVVKRDKNRWELDPASSEDWEDR
jgi:hypothetical protein